MEDMHVWFISMDDTYLYKLNLDDGQIDVVLPLLEKVDMEFAFYDMLVYEEFFVFVPCKFDSILFLNRNDWSKEYIKIPKTDWRIGKTGLNFFSGIINNDNIYLFGFSYPGILKMNLKTRQFVNIDYWIDKVELANKICDGCFHVNYYQRGNVVYFPFENMDALMVFDLASEEAAVHTIGDTERGYISIEYSEDNFWLIPRDANITSIVKWNPNNGEIQTYDQYPEGFKVFPYAFYQTVNIGEKILLFAHGSNTNISIDVKRERLETFENLYDIPENGSRYPVAKLIGQHIFFLLRDRFIWWDYHTEEKKETFYVLSENMIRHIENKKIKNDYMKIKNSILYERTDIYNLESYIKYIQILEI